MPTSKPILPGVKQKSASLQSSCLNHRKRKAPLTDQEQPSSIAPAGDAPSAAKKAKRIKQKERRKAKRSDEHESLLDSEQGINTAFAFMDPSLTADYLAQKIEWAGKDLSVVELADLRVSGNLIIDTTSYKDPRTLENLPQFIEKFASADVLKKTPTQNGAPHTVVVTGAGMRAADVVRAMRRFQRKNVKVAKCFAKHIKIDETIRFLNSHRIVVAVGTPQRLIDLVENGALKVNSVRQMVVDASHIDEKKRGVLDMKETILPLCRWLNLSHFKEKYTGDEPLKLMFY